MGGESCEGVGDLRACRDGMLDGGMVAGCGEVCEEYLVCLDGEAYNTSSRISSTRSGLPRQSVYMNK